MPGRTDRSVRRTQMKAVTWHGKRDIRVDTVPDPKIEDPTDAIVRITTTGICGSDLHLYETLGPFMSEGDILGHEPMGIVEEVGSAVTNVAIGDRVAGPSRAARLSWCASRRRRTRRSRFLTVRPTSVSCFCRTFCPPLGRRWST